MKISIISNQLKFLNKLLSILRINYSLSNIDVYEDLNRYQNCGRYYDILLVDLDTVSKEGLDNLKRNSHFSNYIIFLASDKRFMEDAFGINVVGYVLKEQIYDKLLDKIDSVNGLNIQNRIYEFKSERQIVRIPENKILYILFMDGSIYLTLDHGYKIVLSYRTLIEVNRILSSLFWRINRNCIVNKDKIMLYDHKNHEIKLENGDVFHVSRREWHLLNKKD